MNNKINSLKPFLFFLFAFLCSFRAQCATLEHLEYQLDINYIQITSVFKSFESKLGSSIRENSLESFNCQKYFNSRRAEKKIIILCIQIP